MDIHPLVSVVIVTYNSSSTIIETLDSIKEQTYSNLELIISDDCSKDDTVLLCKKWIKENKESLQRIELVESPCNTGVSVNLNRGINRAKGEWIKSIAGDDLLTPEAIDTYVSFVCKNPNCRICMAKLYLFGTKQSFLSGKESYLNRLYIILASQNRRKQYRRALIEHILPGPGIFYQKELWKEIGGFNEKYNQSEEWPFEIKVTLLTPIYLLDKKVVKWRFSDNSLSNNHKSVSYKQNQQFYWDERRYLIKDEYGWLARLDSDLYYLYEQSGYCFFRLLRFFSPFYYLRKFYWK